MRKRYPLLAALAAVLLSLPSAQCQDEEPDLAEALQFAIAHQTGADAGEFAAVESAVVEAAKEPVARREAETLLLDTLAKATSREAKVLLCKQLFVVGSEASVPALSKLLTDPDLCDIARYVLGRMESPRAKESLVAALAQTRGMARVGLINTLGALRHEAAIPALSKLLTDPSDATSTAAAAALGRIGTVAAAESLQTAAASATGAFSGTLDVALLDCADALRTSGNASEADRLYDGAFADGKPANIRLAALRGLATTRGAKALPLLTDALRAGDEKLRNAAIGIAVGMPGAEATGELTRLLPGLDTTTQALLIGALGRRGDSTAVPALVTAAASDDEAIRTAALAALGTTGGTGELQLLLTAAATREGDEAAAARRALQSLSADGVDEAIAAALSAEEPAVRREALGALTARKAKSACPQMLKLARDPERETRYAALDAVGALGGAEVLPALTEVVLHPVEDGDRGVAEEALTAVFQRVADREQCAAPLLAAYPNASAEAKPTLLALLGRTGANSALQAIREAAGSPEAELQDAAVQALADWPDVALADELLALAKTSENEVHKVLALRGYVRMAGESDDPAAMYLKAIEMAERPEEKKLALSGLSSADTAEALTLAERFLDDEAVATEAALAVVKIADKLRKRDGDRAAGALHGVLTVAEDQTVRKQAQEILNDMSKYDGHILAWVGAGPFRAEGKKGLALHDVAFPPEQPGAEVVWKRLKKGVGDWNVNLDQALKNGDNCAGYVRTRIWSPVEQKVQLEMGSDDSLKVWLNGDVIHSNKTNRGCSPRQDLVAADLHEGWNDLMLKVVDDTGGWAVACRVRDAEGGPLEGLKFEAPEVK